MLEQTFLSASEVQQMLGIPDLENLCYGYTFSRESVYIYFDNGKLVRTDGGNHDLSLVKRECAYFNPSFFHENIKRWYEDTVNLKLATLMRSFGCGYLDNTTPRG